METNHKFDVFRFEMLHLISNIHAGNVSRFKIYFFLPVFIVRLIHIGILIKNPKQPYNDYFIKRLKKLVACF
jgi:hypothetical protein